MKKVLKIVGLVVLVIVVIGGIRIGTLAYQYRGYILGNNNKYALEKVEALKNSPLEGKHIGYLGSSVTDGAASKGVSFVEYIGKRNQCTYVKEAVSGTTLVDNGENSYIQRMLNNINASEEFDLFVCQLSTNDASQNMPLGAVSESMSLDDFDTNTIIGAMEYIICYAQQTWGCPVVFYTGTEFESELYPQMIDGLYELHEKWDVEIIDLWNGLDVNIKDYHLYMVDNIHPTMAGYLEWWTPFMEQRMYEIIEE